MKVTRYTIIKEDYNKLRELCPLNTYRVFDPDQIPISLPPELLDKSFKAVVVGSGDMYNAVYMINLLRVDRSAVDQQPLIIAYHSGDEGIDLTGGFIQHGDWEGRTIYPSTAFFQAIESSGIKEHYPYVGVPEKDHGNIVELTPDSHRHAFWYGIKMIKVGE